MKSQKTSRDDASHEKSGAQAASLAGSQASGDAGRNRDQHELDQAARSVMRPERHEPEWRYFHGATHG